MFINKNKFLSMVMFGSLIWQAIVYSSCQTAKNIMYRPKISLHILINNPMTSLQISFNPNPNLQ